MANEDSELPEKVSALLEERIESLEHLEALLLLRSEPTASFTAASVGAKLGIPEALAASALEHLCRGNLLSVRVGLGKDALLFRFEPGTTALGEAVDELADVYASKRLLVLSRVSANAIGRARNMVIRMFADSFLIGQKKSGPKKKQ